MKFKVTTLQADIVQPVTRVEAKAHCRVENAFLEDDTYFDELISTAREYIETETGRHLAEVAAEVYLNDFAAEIELPFWPLNSIESITYKDENEATQTLDPANYVIDKYGTPPQIFIEDAPATYRSTEALSVDNVTITAKVGYKPAGGIELPLRLKRGILVAIRDMYDVRASETEGKSVNENNMSLQHIIQHYRIYEFH